MVQLKSPQYQSKIRCLNVHRCYWQIGFPEWGFEVSLSLIFYLYERFPVLKAHSQPQSVVLECSLEFFLWDCY